MIYIAIFVLIAFACWCAYHIGYRDGMRDHQVINAVAHASIDIAVVKAVIEQEGWVVLDARKPRPEVPTCKH